MIDFDKELDTILETDPLGLLDIKPKATAITGDERLLSSFEEINSFIQEHGHEPTQSRDINERKLYSRLKGLRENPEKSISLSEYDTFNLLGDIKMPEPKEINTIDDVLNDDALGLLDDDIGAEADPGEIFNLRNVPKHINKADYVAKRKSCENFEKYEERFKEVHKDLMHGRRKIQEFKDHDLRDGGYFVLDGVLLYLESIDAKIQEQEFSSGGRTRKDGRTHCIFENGTESNMLYRSLSKQLYKGGKSVTESLEESHDTFLKNMSGINEEDEETGYIYVLSSLSEDPQIKGIDDLYKIGFSTQSVQQRIKNAAKEPTYLMADVRVVTEFQTFNLNPQKMEMLLHRFFAETCLNLDIFDAEGSRHTPREWFIVPLNIIESVVGLLINGQIVNYHYDVDAQEIVFNL